MHTCVKQRIMSAHGGQILLSGATRALRDAPPVPISRTWENDG
jgi:hypothetical protein